MSNSVFQIARGEISNDFIKHKVKITGVVSFQIPVETTGMIDLVNTINKNNAGQPAYQVDKILLLKLIEAAKEKVALGNCDAKVNSINLEILP